MMQEDKCNHTDAYGSTVLDSMCMLCHQQVSEVSREAFALRDKFACAALASMGPIAPCSDLETVAEFSYKIADAMLKARIK